MNQDKIIEFLKSHGHIIELGRFNESGDLEEDNSGFVGQVAAREATALLINKIGLKEMSGEIVLLVGSPSTGKSAISAAILKVLQHTVIPFALMNADEVFINQAEKDENGEKKVVAKGVTPLFTENLRRSMGLEVGKLIVEYKCQKVQLTTTSRTLTFRATRYNEETKEIITSVVVNAIDHNVELFGRDLATSPPYPNPTMSRPISGFDSLTLHTLDESWKLNEGNCSDNHAQLVRIRNEVDEHVKLALETNTVILWPGVILITGLSLLSNDPSSFFADLVKAREQLTYPFLAPTFLVVANYDSQLKMSLNKMDELYPKEHTTSDIKFVICTEEYDEQEVEKIFQVIAKSAGYSICEPVLKYLMEIYCKGSPRLAHLILDNAFKFKVEKSTSPVIDMLIVKEVVKQMKSAKVDIPN